MNEESTEFNLREELEAIDNSIEEQKAILELAEAIKRLEDNEDYKKVVTGAYLDEEAKRLCEVLVEPNPLKRDQLENIMEMTSAIRHFKTFMKFKKYDAVNAEHTIEQLNAMRAERCAMQAEGK